MEETPPGSGIFLLLCGVGVKRGGAPSYQNEPFSAWRMQNRQDGVILGRKIYLREWCKSSCSFIESIWGKITSEIHDNKHPPSQRSPAPFSPAPNTRISPFGIFEMLTSMSFPISWAGSVSCAERKRRRKRMRRERMENRAVVFLLPLVTHLANLERGFSFDK